MLAPKGIASYLIVGPAGNILMDTAMSEATGQIKANIQKLGVKLPTSSSF
jgi:metallo-beta-lactamase class B